MMNKILLSLPSVFLLTLLISFLLYVVGMKIAPKVKKTASKLTPYACGEALPARKFQMNVRRFFLFVVYFLIFDISAVTVALSFSAKGIYPILFLVIIVCSLLPILPMISGKRR